VFLTLAQVTERLALPQTANVMLQSKSAEVYEAVIEFQIKSWDLSADSFCIEINGRDADIEILKHIGSARVKQASACKKQDSGPKKSFMSVVDKRTRKHSVIFDIEDIRWSGDAEAEIDGGWLCGDLCMAGGVYHAAHDQSGWHVTRFDAHIMS